MILRRKPPAPGAGEIAVLAHRTPAVIYNLVLMFMQAKTCLLVLAALSGGVLGAQDQAPPAQPPPPPSVEKLPNYVRRASIGVTLSVLGLSLVPDNSYTTSTTGPAVTTDFNTKGASQRIGYGVTGQLAITNHFAFTASLLLRRIGYQETTTISAGTTTITTTMTHEDTRARLIDVPVAIRFYNKSRHDPGPRWFFEAGGAFRQVSLIRTSIDTTDSSGTVTCCTTDKPAAPAHKSIHGFVGGAGLQLIDPVGIRVVPEVRYTRWMGSIFDLLSTHGQRNQVEAIISLTF